MAEEKTSPHEFEFEIRSQNATVSPTQSMVAAMQESVGELSAELNAKYGDIDVKVCQKQTFPFDPVTVTMQEEVATTLANLNEQATAVQAYEQLSALYAGVLREDSSSRGGGPT
jgi:hypothetical protein